MKRNFSSLSKVGFSMIEVVLAVALLGLTIVAVIGLLGTVSRSVTDVQDYTTAGQVSDTIQDEFSRMGYQQLEFLLNNNNPVLLFGNRTGDHVALEESLIPGSDEYDDFPPRDWYFSISVERLESGHIDTNDDWESQISYQPFSNFMTLRVEVRWPHHIPRGPGPEDYSEYYDENENRQRMAVYYMSFNR